MPVLNGLTEIERIYELQERRLESVDRTTCPERRAKLQRLLNEIYKSKSSILEALKSDLGKSFTEGEISEIYPVVSEIKHTLRNLNSWMKPKRVRTPLTMFGSRSKILYEPKGLTLIMSPWNYPFLLTISPLISAIAGGNCSIIKPSEKSSATSGIVKKIINEIFLEEEIAVVEGDHIVGSELLKLNFDHIFYTGSTGVGKIVMQAAAKNLTSVTLELGGKSPTIIDGTFNIKLCAERIAWGKFMNAGQTCITPDYVLVKDNIVDEFIKELKKQVAKFYSDNGDFSSSLCYSRLINENHTDRLNETILKEIEAGAKIISGGNSDIDKKFIEPTIITGVAVDGPVMSEEIFGPILPILTYKTFEDIIEVVRKNPNPLAMYIFSDDKKFTSSIINRIPSGGVTLNGVLLHFANTNLPFGGVRGSGMGRSHGHSGFMEFTNERAIVKQSKISPVGLLYPPYTNAKKKLTDFITRYL